MSDKDYSGKMARMLRYAEEVPPAPTVTSPPNAGRGAYWVTVGSGQVNGVYKLDRPAVGVLRVFVTSGGADMPPILHGNAATTGKYVWDPKQNTIEFYHQEGDSGAATIGYLSEAPV